MRVKNPAGLPSNTSWDVLGWAGRQTAGRAAKILELDGAGKIMRLGYEVLKKEIKGRWNLAVNTIASVR